MEQRRSLHRFSLGVREHRLCFQDARNTPPNVNLPNGPIQQKIAKDIVQSGASKKAQQAEHQKVTQELSKDLAELKQQMDKKQTKINVELARRLRESLERLRKTSPDLLNHLIPDAAQQEVIFQQLDAVLRNPQTQSQEQLLQSLGILPDEKRLQDMVRGFNVVRFEQNLRKRVEEALVPASKAAVDLARKFGLDLDEEQVREMVVTGVFYLGRLLIGNLFSTAKPRLNIPAFRKIGRTIHERLVIDAYQKNNNNLLPTGAAMKRWATLYDSAAHNARLQNQREFDIPTVENAMDLTFDIVRLDSDDAKRKREEEERKKKGAPSVRPDGIEWGTNTRLEVTDRADGAKTVNFIDGRPSVTFTKSDGKYVMEFAENSGQRKIELIDAFTNPARPAPFAKLELGRDADPSYYAVIFNNGTPAESIKLGALLSAAIRAPGKPKAKFTSRTVASFES